MNTADKTDTTEHNIAITEDNENPPVQLDLFAPVQLDLFENTPQQIKR